MALQDCISHSVVPVFWKGAEHAAVEGDFSRDRDKSEFSCGFQQINYGASWTENLRKETVLSKCELLVVCGSEKGRGVLDVPQISARAAEKDSAPVGSGGGDGGRAGSGGSAPALAAEMGSCLTAQGMVTFATSP